MNKTLRAAVISALMAMGGGLAYTDVAMAQASAQAYQIPAGDLDGVLRQYASQSRVQLIYSAESVRGKKSAGLSGDHTPTEALQHLLVGTGLQAETVNAKTIALRPSAKAASPPAEKRKPPPQSKADLTKVIELEEIVVTGTYIRGETPVGVNVITLDREEIERSGLATIQEVIRRLPQNYRGGVSEEFGTGREADTDTVDGNALNLRGLGSGATLVLLNGRRLATTGGEGIFTDISNIPLSAVERIEVLLDGASALYGSDAVGGVVNIILRKDYAGAETRFRAGATTEGDAEEYQFAQSFGAGWSTGNGLISYEYYEREELPKRARERSANCDLTRFGGDNFCNAFSNPGNILAGDQTYAIPRGQDGTSLTPSDFIAGTVNLANPNAVETLLPMQQRHSVSAFVTQSVGDRLTLEGAGLFSRRESSRRGAAPIEFLFVTDINPFFVNPAGGADPVFVQYSFEDDFGPTITRTEINAYNATLTAKYEVTDSWLVTADIGYARDEHERIADGILQRDEFSTPLVFQALEDPDPATAFNPFGDGSHTNPDTIARIRGRGDFSGDSDLMTVRAVAEGPLVRLPGGNMRLAVGAEQRSQSFNGLGHDASPLPPFIQQYERDLWAGFAELRLPLAAPENGVPGLYRLNLSLAGRYEEYSDFGETANPKLGVDWSPFAGLTIRGAWGTSFKAPSVLDLDETFNFTFIFPIPDPLSETGFSDALIWTGGNADLQEETATTWTVGIDIAPPSTPNLKFSVGYFDIEFENRIELVLDPLSALLDPAFADIVTRNPTAEQRAEACARSTFVSALEDCLNAPIGAFVDSRIGNSAIVRNRGLDFMGAYEVKSEAGTFAFNLNATYLIEFGRALRSNSPVTDILDTPFNPLSFKLRGSASWTRGGLETTLYLNYADGYRDTLSDPERRIDSWTTFDFAASYDLPVRDAGLLKGIELALNVQNLFDEDPPFFNNPNSVGYDPVNASLLGRFVSLQLRKSW